MFSTSVTTLSPSPEKSRPVVLRSCCGFEPSRSGATLNAFDSFGRMLVSYSWIRFAIWASVTVVWLGSAARQSPGFMSVPMTPSGPGPVATHTSMCSPTPRSVNSCR